MDYSTLPDQVEYDSIDSTEHLGLRVLNTQSVLICLVSKTTYEEKLVEKNIPIALTNKSSRSIHKLKCCERLYRQLNWEEPQCSLPSSRPWPPPCPPDQSVPISGVFSTITTTTVNIIINNNNNNSNNNNEIDIFINNTKAVLPRLEVECPNIWRLSPKE